MLSRETPFSSPDRDSAATMRKTVKCSLHLQRPPFDSMTSRLRNILRQLICKSQDDRLTAAAALEHSWIVGKSDKTGSSSSSKKKEKVLEPLSPVPVVEERSGADAGQTQPDDTPTQGGYLQSAGVQQSNLPLAQRRNNNLVLYHMAQSSLCCQVCERSMDVVLQDNLTTVMLARSWESGIVSIMGWMRCGSFLALLALAGASNISCLDSFRSVTPLSIQEKHCLLPQLDALVDSPQRFYFEKIGVVVGYEILSKLGEIEFTFAVPTTGWFGFGISEVGSMIGADMVILEDGPNGFELTDSYSHGFERPVADKLQNWQAQSITHLSLGETCLGQTVVTKAVLRRMMKTCDAEDEDLGPQWIQNYFVAAYGDGRMNYHGQALEAVEVDILGPSIR
ncbi:moxd2, partial [Symbiodinium necroappetens]